jgi:hypothetical protein
MYGREGTRGVGLQGRGLLRVGEWFPTGDGAVAVNRYFVLLNKDGSNNIQ